MNTSFFDRHPGVKSEPAFQRSAGVIDVAFKADRAGTRISRSYQSGCGKIRFPSQHDGMNPTGVMINTAGGLTGGDRMTVKIVAANRTQATLTTQAAEKIYRSAGNTASIVNCLTLGQGARLDWLPQETILFDRCGLDRRTIVTMADDAVFTATELLVFGRTAMGERVTDGRIIDSWRITRGDRLVFADAVRISGPIATMLAQPASANGFAAVAVIIHVAPETHEKLQTVRAKLGAISGIRAGASSFDGLTIVRMVADEASRLRWGALAVMEILRDGISAPRTWML